ncbi:ATP synthase subunit I [Tibeticola sp.]|jgi:ATP synthase protein I|uniref:ATP synthase subunit I n=1 Tax=Tibeticola sp. TaxID=2005368 RepID=UPI002587A02C|nr:ATP synthase subunit I [Tibeticola sp.]MCI4439738.1 ATP synthase subunit I [Tibeticola sp.]
MTRDDSAEEFKPLSAEEARALLERLPRLSPWRVVWVQAIVGFIVAAMAGALSGRLAVLGSAAYGAMAVVLPTAVLARGISGKAASGASQSAMRFFVWEAAKVGLTVALLMLAPRLVPGLSWPALLIGLVLTMKAYWVALWRRASFGN